MEHYKIKEIGKPNYNDFKWKEQILQDLYDNMIKLYEYLKRDGRSDDARMMAYVALDKANRELSLMLKRKTAKKK